MADTTEGEDLQTVTVSSNGQVDGEVVYPRAIVKLGGQIVDGWLSWEVTSNSFYEADTFRVSFVIGDLPDSNNLNWFSTQKEIFVEILAGFPSNHDQPDPSELQSLIYGRVDNMDPDLAEGIIDLTGRDLTAVFIDSKITSQYVNKTSSQIVTTLAGRHAGMTASAQATKTRAGTYYDKDQVQLQASRSEWDLITYLARKEGFVAYVSGMTLFFQPNPVDESNAYDITWEPPSDDNASPSSNTQSLKFSRDLTVGKGIAVTARSANFLTGKAVVQSYPSQAKAIQAGKASPFGKVQNFYFNMSAGHTPVEVEAFAKAQYDIIISHEMKLTARLPGDNRLSILTPIKVTGTGTAWDQTYFPRSITREMSIDAGYEMTVEAQNVNPDSSPES
jgi:hypothetical protein